MRAPPPRPSWRDRPAPQVQRRGPLTDFFEQPVQVLLGALYSADKFERLGAAFHLQGQHLQAGFAALQGVATFVDQGGHGFADGSQSAGLTRALFRALPVGNVTQRD